MGTQERAFAIIMLCGIVGIVFAIILQLLYDQNIFVDEFITETLVLRELQFMVFLGWEVLGIGVAAHES